MRYIKVLIIAAFFFLALVFFFQNQGPLSQEMQLTLNLFFIPPITSISLPFYFLLVGSFVLGCLLALAFLLWDKFSTSTKLMRSKWKIKSLQSKVDRYEKQLAAMNKEHTAAALPASDTGHPADPEKAN